jgi:hypothetical protein
MHDRVRLREALAGAIAAAQEAGAPDRMLTLLRAAYRSLDSARFVDEDMIRWAEAGLAAWRRWASAPLTTEHRLLVVDPGGELAAALRTVGSDDSGIHVEAVGTRNATLEALATQSPTVIVFDLDAVELAPSVEMLEWLATEFGQLRRIGYSAAVDRHLLLRDRRLYHAVLTKPPARATLLAALESSAKYRFSVG